MYKNMLSYISIYIPYGPKNHYKYWWIFASKPHVSLALPLFIHSNLSLIISVSLTSLEAIGIVKFTSLEKAVVLYKYLTTPHLKFSKESWQENTPEDSCLFHYKKFYIKEL